MYFKQLELTGFKSFADRTVLRLEPGVTSIVGPNGCGKSNILDSMRWVLGEQRAKELRGSHMQDVIFNGSEGRRPSGMAEVTVTFDNADSKLPIDFSEVSITRRVYRSGESEYLINKALCRLRDIQELFMDTGVGTQAYSIVGQGKMDLILSSKPEDRRYLFEEAAGIIKYKNRKRIAIRRLQSAEQNLLRLGDIIAEVQRQMRSLKRQVNAAIRYREISEQLRDLEIRAAWLKHTHLSQQIGELREKFAKSTDAYEEVSTKITRLEARREELGLANLELERVLLARREGVHEIDTEMERIERSIALLRQQIDYSKEHQQQAKAEEEAFQNRATTLDTSSKEAESNAAQALEELEACGKELEAKQQEHGEASERLGVVEAEVESMRARAVEKMNDRARTMTELETLGVSITNVDEQLRAIYERQERLSHRREELLGLLETARRNESETETTLDGIVGKREQAQQQRTDKQQAQREVSDQWQSLRESKSSLEARLKSLRELRDSYEGFAAGVRAVMLAKDKQLAEMRGIVGPVGDLLSPEKTYERAIEAALGGNINNVIVEDADAAKGAIQFLKEHRAGRVTFLPLDIIRGRRHDSNPLAGKPGVVGPAIDFVEFDPKLQNAVEYLFNGTIIVETLDDAIRIARQGRSYPRLVTLDGEVVSSAGAVTGGRLKHESRGLLGRSAEIKELEEQVGDAEGRLSELAKERDGLGEALQVLSQQIRELEQQEVATRRQLNELQLTVARHSTEQESLTQSAENLDQERDDLCTQRERLEESRVEAAARADTMETEDEAFQQELANAQEAASRARQALSVCASELADLRVRQAELARRREEIAREQERQQHEREDALREAELRAKQATEFLEEQGRLEQEIGVNVERSKALSESKEEAREKVVEAENQRQDLLDESETLDKELREGREIARESQSEVHQLELNLRQSEDRIEFFQERILSEYNIALSSLNEDEVGEDEYDEDTRDQLVSDLRARLQRMGDVNLMAIEEYEELEKRNEFLVTQSDDLNKARETLLDVIARSDKKIREMFMETFNAVGEHFREFFRRLFNGGQARVYLLDEDDPLESGIEIEARPPGKKPQSISLLSGGESAMTAIALLFSIFKAKPSPFCILDEVDAPLDDANIGRFLSLLDEFASDSQFVVITHNKQTMTRADALYGVTMQERGVSELVSVKFNEAESAA